MTLDKRLTICPELRAFNSYGVLTAHLVKAWVASGIYPSIRPLALQDALGASVPRYVKEKIVHSDQPEPWELYISPAVHVPNQRKRVAFYSMYESTLWPPRSIRLLNKSELVIVPCEWCRVGLHDSGLTRPVEVVPLGTDETIFTPTPVSAEGPCVFGAAGRLANGSKRKAVNAVLEAFLKEFPDEPDVRLKIKAFSDCPPAATIDPRVNVTEKFLTDAQMADWYRSLTCFVSASRSEGWGLNPLEAMFCIPDGELLWTNSGMKPIESIVEGDQILDAGGLQPVLSKFRRHYSGEIVTIRPVGLPELKLTPGHLVMACKMEWVYDPALRKSGKFCRRRTPVDIGWVKAGDVSNNHCVFLPKITTPVMLNIQNEASMELLGWYAAEGHISRKLGTHGYHSTVFTVLEEEADHLCYLIHAVAGKNTSWKKTKNSKAGRIILYGKKWADIFETTIGCGARNKSVPSFLFNSEDSCIKAFLKGYISGDGHVRRDGVSIKTVSEKMAKGVLVLLSRLGCSGNWGNPLKAKNEYIQGRLCRVKKKYIVGFCGKNAHRLGYPCHPGSKSASLETNGGYWVGVRVGLSSFSGFVNNFTTPTGTYLAPFIQVHNCGRACIAPIYSGHKEFLTEDNCYSLDFKEVPAEEIWTGHGNWCEPDTRHLQKLMRSVYKNRQDAIERGARAHESVRHLTWKATAVRLAALVIDDLGR